VRIGKTRFPIFNCEHNHDCCSWYALTWYQGDISQWLRIAEVVGLCVLGVAAYVIGLLITGFRPRHLKH
jgi:hypothetical protein